MNRFDLPVSFRDFLTVALRQEVIDASEAFCEGASFATEADLVGDGPAIRVAVDRVLVAAFAGRHSNNGAHRACVKAAEAVWKAVPASR